MAQQGDALSPGALENWMDSITNKEIELMHDAFETIARNRTSPASGEREVLLRGQPLLKLMSLEEIHSNQQIYSVLDMEDIMIKSGGRLVQPGAGASSSRGLRYNTSEIRGYLLPTSSLKR